MAPPEYVTRYNFSDAERNVLAGMLTCADAGLGRVLNALERRGMLEDTIVVVTTDNGAPGPNYCSPNHGQNFPHRGSKCSYYQGGVRGTSLVFNRKRVPAGTRGGLFHAVDWHPTLAGVAGANMSTQPLDGFDQWAMITNGTASKRDSILLNSELLPNRTAVLRSDGWKLIAGNGTLSDNTV